MTLTLRATSTKWYLLDSKMYICFYFNISKIGIQLAVMASYNAVTRRQLWCSCTCANFMVIPGSMPRKLQTLDISGNQPFKERIRILVVVWKLFPWHRLVGSRKHEHQNLYIRVPGWPGSRSQGREMEHRFGVELAGDSVTPSLLAPPPLKKPLVD